MNRVKIKFAQCDDLFIAYSEAVKSALLENEKIQVPLNELPSINNTPLMIFGSSYAEAKYIGFALVEQDVTLPDKLLFGEVPSDLDNDSKQYLIDSHIKYIKGKSNIASETSISLIHWNNSLKIPLFGELEQIAAILENFKYNKVEENIDDESDLDDLEYQEAANLCNEYSIYLWPSFEINPRLNHICLSLKRVVYGYSPELKGHGKYQHFELDDYKNDYYIAVINELNTLISDRKNLRMPNVVPMFRPKAHFEFIKKFKSMVLSLKGCLPAQHHEKIAMGARSNNENVALEQTFEFEIIREKESGKLILIIDGTVKNKEQKYRINNEPDIFLANEDGCIELPSSIKLLDGDSYTVTWTENEDDKTHEIKIDVSRD